MNKIPDSVISFIDKFNNYQLEVKKNYPGKVFMAIPEISAQEAIYILGDVLLGENWYITDSICEAQANAIILDEILRKYCKNYKKEFKKRWSKVNGRKMPNL